MASEEILTDSIPTTMAGALDPAWLSDALRPIGGGAKVTHVETVEVIRTVATKIRFTVRFAGSDEIHSLCLKGFLDVDEATARGGPTTLLEADFYSRIAPHIDVRVPACISSIVDRANPRGIIIMRDLIAGGDRFCTARDAISADEAAESLTQLAKLHASRGLLDTAPWISPRVAELAAAKYVSAEQLQQMLDGPRGEGLPAATLSAARLIAGMDALAAVDAGRPNYLVHGDCHAGNIYRTGEGPGLIDWQLLQRGGWALDIGYHIPAVLTVALAEREERRLLRHYLDVMRGLGCDMPEDELAWRQYREAAIYGFYLWSITRRVEPDIINLFVNRLGSAVTRHGTHQLLGVA